ncbi:MAG TPA: hypothetical protein DEH11_09760 [Actinobacteria bacterium]|nr:hypothetical protein [Actinomycetota bacterium]
MAVVLVVIAVLIRKPVEHAAHTGLHVLGEILEITAIILASGLGLAVLGAMAYAGLRVHRWHAAGAPRPARQLEPLKAAATISPPRARPIEAARPRLYVISSEHSTEEKP